MYYDIYCWSYREIIVTNYYLKWRNNKLIIIYLFVSILKVVYKYAWPTVRLLGMTSTVTIRFISYYYNALLLIYFNAFDMIKKYSKFSGLAGIKRMF